MSPLLPFESVVLFQSVEMKTCFTIDESKTTQKCFQQISTSQTEKDFEVDKECCEIVMKMNKKCNNYVCLLFKSRFFVPLQNSCHIKPTKN
ncbi:hypothetical protein HID58_037852 [Brassica napus]|uniref:Prolamin-like domain-containing protein n=2 Tax=Brassica TaxID=3705 RepID=A0ABQ8BP47_BRANA|nr:hypothetical protein HID58_037852 [Brassica napus]